MNRADRPRAGLGWALAALAVVFGSAAADAALVLRLEPAQPSVPAGTVVTVNVVVESDAAVDVFGFDVRLQAGGGGFTGGDYPGAPGAATGDYIFPGNTGAFFAANPLDAGNNPSGTPSVKIFLADISEDPAGFATLPANTPKLLGVVTFKAAGAGAYALGFDGSDPDFLRVTDSGGGPITIDAATGTTITATPSAAVPAPPAAGLLLVGAAFLPLARRLGLRR